NPIVFAENSVTKATSFRVTRRPVSSYASLMAVSLIDSPTLRAPFGNPHRPCSYTINTDGFFPTMPPAAKLISSFVFKQSPLSFFCYAVHATYFNQSCIDRGSLKHPLHLLSMS